MKKVFPFLSLIIALVIVSCSSDDNDKVVQSSLNSITSFKINFEGLSEDDVIYDLGNNITISVPFKTDITGLVPNITISDKATISPASGEAVNFVDGEAMPFTVTAENGDEKVYNVTINIRGEVGSGSKIKSYKEASSTFGDILIEYRYDEVSNFVKSYDYTEGGNKTTFDLIFNDKNQIIEKRSDDDNVVTYTYNDLGLIASAVEKKEGKALYSYTYTYDDNQRLVKNVRETKEDGSITNTSYTYNKEGNVASLTIGTEEYKSTYDKKNNPFKGIYPEAFAKINISASLNGVNVNNPIKGTFSYDTDVTIEYNTDDYPVTASYVLFGTYNFDITYTYFD
ncbi:DUF4595 domain-containing protein [Tenacibaculum sp. SSH1-16]|uniref:DUF4595 domain-containing protein n=1 Tax=Tenacibaculum sp. SSH1-16 TaxID=3136667 RepID=UPI0012E64219|nr:hypothetical protein BACT7_15210 [Tenacibaculum mesophilum]GFD76598.1 hypothetical protein KUL113_60180 [Tenacibaculum sp. KUL113]